MVKHRLETPRPDLKEDYDLWKVLFQEADYKSKAYTILHGFRCAGAKLVWDEEREMLLMKPRFGNGGPGEGAMWESQEEYQKDRKQWLFGEHQEDIMQAIKTTQKKAKERGFISNKG